MTLAVARAKSETTPSKSATPKAAPVLHRASGDSRRYGLSGRVIQPALRISAAHEPAEREAEQVAAQVTRGGTGQGATGLQRSPLLVQRRAPAAAAGGGAGGGGMASPVVEARVRAAATGGSALVPALRTTLEPRFRADFSSVRLHTDAKAAALATAIGARAFTFGNHIFFNTGQYQPQTPEGMELLAHELTHTIQQQAVIQRAVTEAPTISERTGPEASRLGLSDALNYFADAANAIPGYRMFTILIGVNPINMNAVEASAANILRAIVEFLPGGFIITQVLDSYGIFDRVGGWIEGQLKSLGITGAAIRTAINTFLDSLSWRDIFALGSLWDRAKSIFTTPITRIIAFAKSLFGEILRFVREAVLRPLAALAEGTAGYGLLKAVIGFDPVTGEAVPRTAETIIGGFMTMIGQQELWENIKRANAIPRAWAWFQGALGGLMGLVRSIPERFMAALRGLEIMDFVVLPSAFVKLARVFGTFLLDFGRWALGTVLDLLRIIVEVVAPGVMPYLRKAAGAFNTIIANPVRFVQTLVRAAVQGFRGFASRFLTHLQASLIGWLTGALGGAGLYLPKSLAPMELVKFVLSVLGLTWANIRGKLVAATSETVVTALETGFDIVRTLVTEGPAAAWQKIVETLTNLKQMAIDAIMDFVKSKVVEAAITKLMSLLSPAGALIQAIIATYNTIMFFVERIRQIAQVAAAFIDGIAAIAAGNIAPAAERVEQTMAGLLTLVISFLARIAGLGKVADAVTGLIAKIRAPIDKALDKVVAWIVAQAKKLGKMAKEGVAAIFAWWKEKLGFTNEDGETHTLQFIGTGPNATFGIATSLKSIRSYLDSSPDKKSSDSKKKANWTAANQIFEDQSKVVFGFAKKNAAEAEQRKGIADALAKISAAFIKLSGEPPSEADYEKNTQPVYGNPATVEVIHGTPLSGSAARAWPATGIWKKIQDAELTTIVDSWVQMHIIADKLGGAGDRDANLIPAPNSVNRGPFYGFESKTIALVNARSGSMKNRVWVSVTVSGSKTSPTAISGRAGLYLWKGKKGKWMKVPTPQLTVSVGVPKPNLSGVRKFSLNFTSPKVMVKEFGISAQMAGLIYRGRPYQSTADWAKRMVDAGATTGQITAVRSRRPTLNE